MCASFSVYEILRSVWMNDTFWFIIHSVSFVCNEWNRYSCLPSNCTNRHTNDIICAHEYVACTDLFFYVSIASIVRHVAICRAS